MKSLCVGEEVYAVLVEADDKQEGSLWIGASHESLQAQRMVYPRGKFFRTHHHILNPRTIKRTQEAFVVISGKLAVDVYDVKASLIGVLKAGPGEAIFVYRGGHSVKVLEDFVGYEFKAGAFSLVSEDKEFLDV